MKWYRVVIVLMVAFILTANGQDSEEEENEREPETGLDRPFEENNATILVEDQTWEQLYAEMASTNYSSFEARDDEVLVTHVVYFDITIGDGAPSRVTFGLFGANVPQTVANFRALVHGEDVYVPEVEETRHFGYAGTTFRRLTPWYLQAGSFDTGVHRYGAPLADNIGWKNESFDVPHVGRGWLSMASVGDYFGSQFIVALQKNSWLNGKDVVFGKVLSGIQVIDQIAALPVNNRYYSDVSVTITNCGEFRTEPFMTIKEGVFDFDSYDVADNRLLVTHKVFLNITFGGYPAEPIVIGLFGNTVPRTVENFIGLARGQMKYVEEIGDYKYYGYKGSSFHRIKYSFAQGGGFDVGRDFPGGGPFIDDISSWKNENFDIDHNGAGWVSMANVGSRFGSQFCIAFRNNSFLNGKDVVFGKILTGMDSAVRMRDTPVDDDYHPYETEIRITDSGIIPTEPFTVSLGERRPENKDSKVTQLAYFDITMGGVYTGRILFGLFRELTPITTLNFANLCTGAPGYGFVNSTFFRVIDGFMLQGGYNGRYGSSFGGSFNDENFVIKNRGAGWLGMANAGKNTNGGQIYITTVWTQWLDNKHVIFAKVLSGMDVAHLIEQTEVDPSDRHRPLSPVVITDCQLIDLPEEKHFVVDKEPLNCEL